MSDTVDQPESPQTSPEAPDPQELDLAVGGQAVIEGVMMRSPTAIATAVRTPEGLFVGTSVVDVAPARKAIANFSVVPFASGTPRDRAFPGSEESTAGSAELDRKLTTREFWRSAKGVAILASGGTALLLAIVTSDDEEIVSGF